MNKMRTLQQLRENYLVAVVRGNTEDDAWQKCKQIIEGGILNIEVTFTTPHAETVIKFLSQKYKNEVLIWCRDSFGCYYSTYRNYEWSKLYCESSF